MSRKTVVEGKSVAEVARRYLAGLPDDERVAQQAAIGRFVQWLAADVLIDDLRVADIESYQEQTEASGADQSRLEPVRELLRFAHKHKLTTINLSRGLKLRQKRAAGGENTTRESAVGTEERVHLTSEGYAGLSEELDHLVNVKRPQIAADLYEARIDKDFRENAPFDAAKQHQAEVEARIRFLERVLGSAEIFANATNAERITLGSTVLLRDLTHDEVVAFTLVGSNEAKPQAGRISTVSPVGKAMLDRHVGEEFEVAAPGGVIRYMIERIEAES